MTYTKEEYEALLENVSSAATRNAVDIIDNNGGNRNFESYFVGSIELALSTIIKGYQEAGTPAVQMPLTLLFMAGLDFASRYPDINTKLREEYGTTSPELIADTVGMIYWKLYYFMEAIGNFKDILGKYQDGTMEPDVEDKPELPLTNEEE